MKNMAILKHYVDINDVFYVVIIEKGSLNRVYQLKNKTNDNVVLELSNRDLFLIKVSKIVKIPVAVENVIASW